jgi:hypothetical protein
MNGILSLDPKFVAIDMAAHEAHRKLNRQLPTWALTLIVLVAIAITMAYA